MRWGNVLMGSSNKRRTSSIRDWTYTFFSIYKFPAKLQSNVRLFAGDTIVYMDVTNETDAAILQKDLKLLEEWENRSQMFFHPDKSHGAGPPLTHDYILHNQIIKEKDAVKYLGVTVHHKLSWKIIYAL